MDLINTIRARRPHCAAARSTKPSSLPHGPTERDRRSVSGRGPRRDRLGEVRGAHNFRQIFGSALEDRAERLNSLARSTMECLGRTDALYHNLEHTLLVTLVGRDILRGRTLTERIEAAGYDHLIVACLLHDIGYVRGILKGDTKTHFVIDESGRTVTLPRGASDAALTPYHVKRSKIFVHERLGKSPTLDADRLARAIEATRFPPGHIDDDLEPTLVQAADLIGQLGDPLYGGVLLTPEHRHFQ